MDHRSYVEIIRDVMLRHDVRGLDLVMDDIGDDIGTDFVDVRDRSHSNWLLNYDEYEGITLLELAVLINDAEIVKYLCENYVFGDNIVEKPYTPLHLASKLGYVDVAKILCELCRYSPFQYDYTDIHSHSTPFDIALRYGHTELCEWYLKFVNDYARSKLDR